MVLLGSGVPRGEHRGHVSGDIAVGSRSARGGHELDAARTERHERIVGWKLANKIGNYTKGLPHDANTGEVNINAFNTLDFALRTGTPAAFEAITLGGPRKLVNPQGGWAFEMEGGDGASFRIPPAPKFDSREIAAEMAEDYWMALLRDVPFSQYPTNQIAIDAAADLTLFGADAKVPKDANNRVTPQLQFRGFTPGDRVGPYLAQFFYLRRLLPVRFTRD